MKYNFSAYLAVLLLIAGCRGDKTSQAWEQMSETINAFANTRSGTVLEKSPSAVGVPGCRRWTVFVPVKELSHAGLTSISDSFMKAICDASSSSYPMRGGYTDPTLAESLQDGSISFGAGPALVLEMDGTGESGMILIRAAGLVADLGGGCDLDQMAMHLDLLPTFIDLCGLRHPEGVTFDGASFADYVTGREKSRPDCTQILQINQGTEPPEQWTNAVITQRWRLVHGKELYDITADPNQQNDVAEQHPEVVAQLRAEHEAWWADVTPTFDQFCCISLGNDEENPTRLDAMDVMGDVAWHQTMIVNAKKSTGRWNVDVEQPGKYTISLRRWPEELGLPIDAAVPPEDANSHIYAPGDGSCKTVAPVKARIKLFDREWTQPVQHGMEAVTFAIDMEQTGETQLEAWFSDETGNETGAYYVCVERL